MRPKNTLFIGKVLLQFDELPSTNDYAQELLTKSRPSDGTVITTSYQSAGRGQIGSKWLSSPGKNLTMSVILYPKFLVAKDQFLLSQMLALAVRDFIAAQIDKKVSIKWPNDIYIEDKKVCGLLIQTTLSGGHIQSCILGVGINVNQKDFPDHLAKATSMLLESGITFDLDVLMKTFFTFLESQYLQLRAGKIEAMEKTYRYHLYQLNQKCLYQRPDGSQFEAIITGTDKRGRLLLLHQQLEAFDIKEVQFL